MHVDGQLAVNQGRNGGEHGHWDRGREYAIVCLHFSGSDFLVEPKDPKGVQHLDLGAVLRTWAQQLCMKRTTLTDLCAERSSVAADADVSRAWGGSSLGSWRPQ